MARITFKLNAKARQDVGKGASRRLRHADLVPAILYGTGQAAENIAVIHNDFVKALDHEAFYTSIIDLNIDGKEQKAVLKDLQRHPYRPRLLHADFQRVSATEKLSMNIPLHFKGGDIAPGVKLKSGVVAHLLSEVEIRCLPADLPEYIEVDLSHLDIEETLHLSDLTLPKGTEFVGLVKGSTNDKAVARVYIPRAIVEEAAAPVSAAVETIAEAKAKEEAKAEGKAEGAAATAAPAAKEKGKEKGK